MQEFINSNPEANPLALKLTRELSLHASTPQRTHESNMITTLSQLTSLAESGHRLDAVRLEKNYRPTQSAFALIKAAHKGLSFETYEMILQSSWGKFQIMGDNLYLLGLKVSVIQYCTDDAMQEIYYIKYCASRNIAYTLHEVLADREKLNNYSRRYNGSVKYADRLLSLYEANK